MRKLSIAVLLVLSTVAVCQADDWPQWMGPQRDSVWRETGIVEQLPKQLTIRWRAPVSAGYSGPAVAKGRVIVTDFLRSEGDAKNDPGKRAELTGDERVLCFESSSGKLLWTQKHSCTYRISYPGGPRATPTIDGDCIYTLGAEGRLQCLDLATGSEVWTKELTEAYKTKTPLWGFTGHPLVDGDKLFCLVGGEGSVAVAFDKRTGREIWRALSASEPGYAPPVMIHAGGKPQLVIWHPESINGLNPETGEVYWSEPLKPDYGMSLTAPRQHGDYLFAGGIGNAAALFKLDREKPAAEVVWRGTTTTAVYCGISPPVIEDGVIYGNCCQQGFVRAVDLASGERLWSTLEPTSATRPTSHATAYIIKQADRYVLFNEAGDLITARLTRAGYEELSRTHLIDPTGEAFGRKVAWAHPAFAERSVFARNDQELVCASLAAK